MPSSEQFIAIAITNSQKLQMNCKALTQEGFMNSLEAMAMMEQVDPGPRNGNLYYGQNQRKMELLPLVVYVLHKLHWTVPIQYHHK